MALAWVRVRSPLPFLSLWHSWFHVYHGGLVAGLDVCHRGFCYHVVSSVVAAFQIVLFFHMSLAWRQYISIYWSVLDIPLVAYS